MITLSAHVVAARLEAWTVDPMTKVFRDDPSRVPNVRPVEVARGEMAEWQVVIRSAEPLTDLRASMGPLHGPKEIGTPRIRWEGYVTVDRTYGSPSKDLLRKAPADYPDPLLVSPPAGLAAGLSQPLWIDLPIPKLAPAGNYEATLRVQALSGGKEVSVEVPLQAKVYPVTVGKSRLWVTNWFYTGRGHLPGSDAPGTKGEDAYLAVLAKRMAEHRQNVALIDPIALSRFAWSPDGKMSVDFSRFDRWVEIFKKAGVIGRIEGGHLGGRLGDWDSQFGVRVMEPVGGKPEVQSVPPDDPRADRFYSQYLPALVGHLEKKGWAGIYMQHVGDEPIPSNSASYVKAAGLVRKYAPGLKIVDATHSHDIAGAVDVWVPELDFADQDFDFYRSRQQKGEELWTYTCVGPQGEYANRFIELPLIKTRLLHWLNYRYGITGYLHWGYNYWVKGDPFDDVTRTKANDGWGGFLPAGDSWIVYPKDGKLLDSIRYEAMRDGIADYELLSMLGDRNPAKAHAIAERLVESFTSYDTDIEDFRTARREVLEALSDGS